MSGKRDTTEESGRTRVRRLVAAVPWLRVALAALSGLVAAFTALAVAELVSSAIRPQASPVTAVGGAVIDRTPGQVKDFAVRHFGTNDKLFLQLGILALLAGFALVIGVVALRWRRVGTSGVLVFGLLGAVAAASRPDAGRWDWIPSAVGALTGAAVLYFLAGKLRITAGAATAGAATAREPGAGEGAGPGGRGRAGAWGPGTGVAGERGVEAGPVAVRESGAKPGPEGEVEPEATAAPAAEPEPEPVAAAEPVAQPQLASPAGTFDRRGFMVLALAASALSAGAGVLGRRLNADSGARAAAERASVVLPTPGSRAAPLPRGVDLKLPGLSPFTTPNPSFYRVDTALVAPDVNAETWRLRIHGKGVSKELDLGYRDLLARELIERDITLTCVSNEVGGPYLGNARWIGVPLAPLLREAGVRPPSQGGPADQLLARSVDGMMIGSPVDTVMDGRDAMLAVGMNGEPLPFAHGFPVRMLVPGLYGYVSACKWLKDLELTDFADYDAYWVRRGWSQRAPIKTESRIDTPKPFAQLSTGKVAVAGVAWAQHKGIERVEVRVDGGKWQVADLAAQDTVDTWRQWVWQWPATPGSHQIEVRATDRTGYTQTDARVGTVPNGATGWHSVVVSVG
ncbi:molybdopterin-dependent oxidoreductase [Streptacidiphilus cavernicola]|uniref:Molybdopterin-dependent oxidoreductase n=1 Tax=Streptacidiphilus cavernicola TaxID=3342716 RepID=A0ABV6VXS7_9ACTN